MTIYYSLTFFLLAAEMATFCILVSPLPHTIRKKFFRFLSESPVVAKVAYGLKISFIFVAILFVDALQRMWRATTEADLAKSNGMAHDVRSESNYAARKFYSQRNTYLTGFTLFLSLVLTRTFTIILDLIHTQEECSKLKKEAQKTVDGSEEIEALKKLVKEEQAKSRDFEVLKKQAAQQAAEFDRLATKYNEVTGSISDKRKD